MFGRGECEELGNPYMYFCVFASLWWQGWFAGALRMGDTLARLQFCIITQACLRYLQYKFSLNRYTFLRVTLLVL